MNRPTPAESLTTRQFADAIGCSPFSVRRWIRSGHLRAIRFGTSNWRIPVTELQRLLAAP